MICPKCLTDLENFSWEEGGWCPKCEEWFPPDLVKDFLDEVEEDDPDWGDDLYDEY